MAASASRTAEHGSATEHNVPVPLTSLIGRSSELDGIGETLRRTRLVTLTGPGGVGKTRVATELARGQIGRRADGVWLVDLTAGPADPDPAAELARTLGVGGRSATEPTESLRRYLADRDMLLVIDNCEHVIDACAELASSLLGLVRAPADPGDEPRIARRERRNGMAIGRARAPRMRGGCS